MTKTRVCIDCGININHRGNRAIRCKTCQKEHEKNYQRNYNKKRLGSPTLKPQYNIHYTSTIEDEKEQRERQNATIWDNSLNHPIPIPQYRPRKVVYREWKCGYI